MKDGVFQSSLLERVIHGRPAAVVAAEEIRRLGRERVLVVTSRSIAGATALRDIVDALGSACAGVYSGVVPHSPRECVVEGGIRARTVRADLLLAVGGGSVIDACKVMLVCLRHGYTDVAQLDEQAGRSGQATFRPDDADEWLRVIAIPTTFSAAEFSAFGGATNSATRRKQAYFNPMLIPQVVVLDPALTLGTPVPTLLSTGMKAIDHAVERVINPYATPYSDAVSLLALRMLAGALRKISRDPQDLLARAEAQQGVFLSMRGASAGVPTGLSHAIGHALGTLAGVPHGDTSSLLLPAVLAWTRESSILSQRALCEALGEPDMDAATCVRDLAASLGLPVRLRDVGVDESLLVAIAQATLDDPLVAHCPHPVRSAGDVLEVLRAAW